MSGFNYPEPSTGTAGVPYSPYESPDPVKPVKHEKTPAEKGAATKKAHVAEARKAEAKSVASGGSLREAAERMVSVLRAPGGVSTDVRERVIDELEWALGRDLTDEGREWAELPLGRRSA